MTKYIENNIIFPSVKIYKDVMNIDDTLKSLLYIPAPACSNLLLFRESSFNMTRGGDEDIEGGL